MRHALAITVCLCLFACGSSDPRSPLILGGNIEDTALGLRKLTRSQTEALQAVITTAGRSCSGIEGAYLTEVDANRTESWAVRCLEGDYGVRIDAAGTPASVYRCRGQSFRGVPCVEGFSQRSGRRPRADGPLNPELGDLLAPMTSKDGKTD